MTQITKRLIALLLAMVMMFAVAGCGETEVSSEPDDVVSTDDGVEELGDDDFFDDVIENVEDAPTQNVQTGNDDDDDDDDSSSANLSPDQYFETWKQKNNDYWKKISKNMPNFKGKTLKIYNWNPQEDYPGLATVTKAFTKETGVKVEWIRENGITYISKLTSLIASKKAPDIMRAHSPSPSIWSLCQDISAAKFDDFDNDVWDQNFMNYHTVNGKTYSFNTKLSLFTGPEMLFYNRSLINKYNLEDPYKLWKAGQWTLDKFEEILRAYKKASGNAAIGGDMIDKYLVNIYGIQGEIVFKGGKYVSNLNDSNVVTVMQRAADIVNKENLTVGWGLEEFDKGEILMFQGTAVTAKRMNAYAQNVKSAGNLGTVPWPTAPGSSKTVYLYGDEGFGIVKGASNPEIAPYYVAYVANPGQSGYDMSTYFSDNQALEVFKYFSSLPDENKMAHIGFSDIYTRYVGEYKSISEAYTGKTGAQIPSILDANKNLSDQRADFYNKALGTLK